MPRRAKPTVARPGPRTVVFADLDGTLLDHETYEWAPARPALATLATIGATVVLASSKTRAEIEAWRERIGLDGPFISENGGALYVPADLVVGSWAGAVRDGPLWCVAIGTPYAELRQALPDLATRVGAEFKGFGDLGVREIAAVTGLPRGDAELAARREWDEPFLAEPPLTDAQERRLARAAAARGLQVTRGGRFHHLLGLVSKGRAARTLVAWLERDGRAVRTIGLGDGVNDLELLKAVDEPIVVARPDGLHAPELVMALPAALLTNQPGQRSFAEGIAAVLR